MPLFWRELAAGRRARSSCCRWRRGSRAAPAAARSCPASGCCWTCAGIERVQRLSVGAGLDQCAPAARSSPDPARRPGGAGAAPRAAPPESSTTADDERDEREERDEAVDHRRASPRARVPREQADRTPRAPRRRRRAAASRRAAARRTSDAHRRPRSSAPRPHERQIGRSSPTQAQALAAQPQPRAQAREHGQLVARRPDARGDAELAAARAHHGASAARRSPRPRRRRGAAARCRSRRARGRP